MTSCSVLIDYHVEQHRSDLAAALRACERSECIVVDTSFVNAFVKKRVNASEGVHTMPELFAINSQFLRDFLHSVDDRFCFPLQMRVEYARYMNKLASLIGAPCAALQYHWGSNNLSVEVELKDGRESYDLGVESLRQLIFAGRNLQHRKKVLSAESYFHGTSPVDLKNIEAAARSVAPKPNNYLGQGRRARSDYANHDAEIYAISYALSRQGSGRAVSLVTGDKGFQTIHERFSQGHDSLMHHHRIMPSRGTLQIVHDKGNSGPSVYA